MKCSITMILAVTLLNACGAAPTSDPTPCAQSPILGQWYDSGTGDTLVFKSDCSGTGSRCSEKFTNSVISANTASGTYTKRVSATNGLTQCMPIGDTTCAFSHTTATTLGTSCGGVAGAYVKQ